MSAPVTRRLFFALWPSAPEQAALLAAARPELESCGGRPVPGSTLHVTLCFLGSVPVDRVDALVRIGARAAGEIGSPLELRLDRVLRWRVSQVLCARAATPHRPPPVQALAARLRTLALAAGFTPDEKPFRPHVTLARKVKRSIRSRALAPLIWRFSAFALAESRTAAQGAEYSIVERFALDGAIRRADGA